MAGNSATPVVTGVEAAVVTSAMTFLEITSGTIWETTLATASESRGAEAFATTDSETDQMEPAVAHSASLGLSEDDSLNTV